MAFVKSEEAKALLRDLESKRLRETLDDEVVALVGLDSILEGSAGSPGGSGERYWVRRANEAEAALGVANRRIEGLASSRLCAEFARCDAEKKEMATKLDRLRAALRPFAQEGYRVRGLDHPTLRNLVRECDHARAVLAELDEAP